MRCQQGFIWRAELPVAAIPGLNGKKNKTISLEFSVWEGGFRTISVGLHIVSLLSQWCFNSCVKFQGIGFLPSVPVHKSPRYLIQWKMRGNTLPVNKKDDLVLALHLVQGCFQQSDFLPSSRSCHVVASLPFLAPTQHLKTTRNPLYCVLKTWVQRYSFSNSNLVFPSGYEEHCGMNQKHREENVDFTDYYCIEGKTLTLQINKNWFKAKIRNFDADVAGGVPTLTV